MRQKRPRYELLRLYWSRFKTYWDSSMRCKTRGEVQKWLDSHYVRNYIIHDDLSVDVNGCVELDGQKIRYLPVQFRRVSLWFTICNNPLKSLQGCPSFVGSYFTAFGTHIKNLKGAPQRIGTNFDVSQCPYLISLAGCPKKIPESFFCFESPIKSFLGGPSYVGCTVNADKCSLGSLEHCPEYIGENLSVQFNEITHLDFSPKKLGHNLTITNNPLKTIDGLSCIFSSLIIDDIDFLVKNYMARPMNNFYVIKYHEFKAHSRYMKINHELVQKKESYKKIKI